MYGCSNAASSESALARPTFVPPHSRHPVHRHAHHSPVCTPHPSYAHLASDAAHQGTPQRFGKARCCWDVYEGDEGKPCRSRPLQTARAVPRCSSSVHEHQYRHHHDPSIRQSTDAAFTKSETTLSVPVSLAPTTDAAHARRIKHGPCSGAHSPRSAASLLVQQLPPHEVQTLSLGSRRRAVDCAVAEDRAPEERLARLHRARQLSPPSSLLLGSPTETATPTADIVRLNASSSRPLPSRRVPSRVQRLLCKLEAEAQRTGRTVEDVADGSIDTVELYQALFLQALADGAAWERHARALETSAQASAKREARLTRQLRHARRIVELLAAYVEGAEWVVDVLGRGASSGAGASTQTDRAVPDRTPPMLSSALAESAAEGAAPAVESSYLWSPVSRSAVSEFMCGSFGRSLDLAYGISDCGSRHEEDGDDAEAVAIAAGDAALRRTDSRLHAAGVKGPGGGRAADSLHSEFIRLVHEVGATRWNQSSWDDNMDDVGSGVLVRYAAATAWEDEDRGSAGQTLRRGGTERFEIRTLSDREPPAAVCASEMAHRGSTLSPPRSGASAQAAVVLEGGASHHAVSPLPLPPSLIHAAAIGTTACTESLAHECARLDAAAATVPQPASSSAARGLLELLRSRDTSDRTTAAVAGPAPADTSAGTVSKTTSRIAAAHHNVDYEVTVAEATRSRSSNDTAQSRRALPLMASSSSSSAFRPPLTTPSHSPIPRRSPEPKSEGSASHAASLPSLASSSLPWSHSHALAPPPPPLPRRGHSSSSAMSVKEAAAAAPITVTELARMPSPASLSFLPGQPSTHTTDTQGDDSAAAHSDGGPVYFSNYRVALETTSFTDCSGASSSSSSKRHLEEARGEHHQLVNPSEGIPDEGAEVVCRNGYTEWRAQLEEHLNRDWGSVV